MRLQKLLTDSYLVGAKTFFFRIGDLDVCEVAFMRALGVTTMKSQMPRQYRRIKELILHPELKVTKAFVAMKGDKSAKKRHAMAFIQFVAECTADTSTENEKTKILPYEDVTEVFTEYEAHYKRTPQRAESTHANNIAGRTTFFNGMHELEKANLVKLRGTKGSFETCAICNNLNDALKSSALSWTEHQLSIVLKIKRLHLNQQAFERKDSEQRRMSAAQSFNQCTNFILFTNNLKY